MQHVKHERWFKATMCHIIILDNSLDEEPRQSEIFSPKTFITPYLKPEKACRAVSLFRRATIGVALWSLSVSHRRRLPNRCIFGSDMPFAGAIIPHVYIEHELVHPTTQIKTVVKNHMLVEAQSFPAENRSLSRYPCRSANRKP